MKEQKRTPGPWHARPWFGSDGPIGYSIVDASGNKVPMSAFEGDIFDVEDNIRLMAAAPDLLEALEDVLAWGTDTNWQNAAIAVKRAHEAIAKATGTQA